MEQGPYENNEYEGYEPDANQRRPPQKYQVRPRVDPEAEGEVDPNLYVKNNMKLLL